MVDALGGEVGNLDFQKLLFLFCQGQDEPAYEFVPYHFGAFSFTCYADRRKLIDRGLLEPIEKRWALTPAGRAEVRGDEAATLGTFLAEHGALRGEALVAETYRRFPYSATRSEIASRLLAKDAAALERVEACRPERSGPGLFTIGYEGRSLEGYLNVLLRSGVTLLCDVRRNPLSRKYGFSKKALASGCEKVGIRYQHLPALGIASAKRKQARTRADFDRLFAEYERSTLVSEKRELRRIQDWVAGGESVALTCYERCAEDCHRHRVANALGGLEATDL